MFEQRYLVIETGGYDLIGAVLKQWDEWGYRPILMSQVLLEDGRIKTTLVGEREHLIKFKGIDQTINTGPIDADTGTPCPAIESEL